MAAQVGQEGTTHSGAVMTSTAATVVATTQATILHTGLGTVTTTTPMDILLLVT